MADYSKLPKWFQLAIAEIGTREQPENAGPAIRRYILMAHVGKEGDPWCAIFVNAMLEKSGYQGTRSAGSQSFRQKIALFERIDKPFYGCIVVYWRGTKSSGLGHVGFYNGEEGAYISTIGGNESDMVREEMFPKSSARFGFIGYYKPKKFVLTADNETGPLPVLVPHGIKGTMKVT